MGSCAQNGKDLGTQYCNTLGLQASVCCEDNRLRPAQNQLVVRIRVDGLQMNIGLHIENLILVGGSFISACAA